MGKPNIQQNTQQDIFNSLNPLPHQKSWNGPHYREPHLSHQPRPALFHRLKSAVNASLLFGANRQKVAANRQKVAVGLQKGQDEKYAQYFQGNRILPIPELVEAVQPNTLSLIVTDIRTRRLAGLKKETLKELLKAAGIPARYFCRRSFATWDALLPSQELATKLAGKSIITSKYYRLHAEYMGKKQIKVTVWNVPIQLSGDVLAAFPCDFGDVENFSTIKSSSGTAHGDYSFTMCLNRGVFQAIPITLDYEDQVMMVVVEGRRSQCWHCKQLGHFSRSCTQKTPIITTRQ